MVKAFEIKLPAALNKQNDDVRRSLNKNILKKEYDTRMDQYWNELKSRTPIPGEKKIIPLIKAKRIEVKKILLSDEEALSNDFLFFAYSSFYRIISYSFFFPN